MKARPAAPAKARPAAAAVKARPAAAAMKARPPPRKEPLRFALQRKSVRPIHRTAPHPVWLSEMGSPECRRRMSRGGAQMGVPTARGGAVLRDDAELISIPELEKARQLLLSEG